MLRVRVASTGYQGAPGLSTFYFSPSSETIGEASDVCARVRTFFASLVSKTPTNVTYKISPQVDVVAPVTGLVTGSLIVTPEPASLNGTAMAVNTLPFQVAYLIQWRSSVFLAGRRLVGHTFFSPVAAAANNGVPSAGEAEAIRLAGVALLGPGGPTDVNLVVWRRPRKAGSGKGGLLTARPGDTAPVTTVSVPLKFATLNSRRDA